MSVPQAPAPAHDSANAAALTATYNSLPYPCEPLPQTHPDLMAVMATLQGMTPAPIDGCRVLEIGCGDGTNLLPMAMLYPQSQFLGIDLSPRQIAQGQSICSELGLANLELLCADLLTLDAGIGAFDYIICHGVYSWVPPRVQDGILMSCGRHLSAQGVAYISYNTYPGAHKQQELREMMLYHIASIADPIEAARQALAMLDFLLRNQVDQDSTFALLLREEFDRLCRLPLGYLSHDHLELENHPCYFHEFIARARKHGLQFLAEADKSGSELLPTAAQQALAEMRLDVIRSEQYIDFLRNSSFRSTLLCRADVTLSRDVAAQRVKSLQVRGLATPKIAVPDVRAPGVVEFSTRYGPASVEHPALKALALALHDARPGTLSIDALATRVSALLGASVPVAPLCELVHYASRTGFVALHMQDRPLASRSCERPQTTALARLAARRQLGVANLWHQLVNVDALERFILQKLDGTQDSDSLNAELLAALKEGLRPIGLDANPDATPEGAAQLLSRILDNLHANSLLTSC
jgi:SAM-dependent methyltransferase